jgi:hypothetical protein
MEHCLRVALPGPAQQQAFGLDGFPWFYAVVFH